MTRNFWTGLVAAFLMPSASSLSLAQNATPSNQSPNQQSESKQALEFLGSYSAPSVIATTETGHTSAHPPSPPVSNRLRRIEVGLELLPPWPADLAWDARALESACRFPADLTGEVRRAEAALAQAAWGQATLLYQRLPECVPVSWNAALVRAYADLPDALPALIAALPEAPSRAIGRLALGLERLSRGDSRGAWADSQAALDEKETQEDEAGATKPSAGLHERDRRWALAMLRWASGDVVGARHEFTRPLSLEAENETVWFALGGVALEEARASSRRLAESVPDSLWNRRLESEALSARYPLLANEVFAEKLKAKFASGVQNEHPAAGPAPSTPSGEQLEAQLQWLEYAQESPEMLYRRARTALELSEMAYRRASHSPLFRAQLRALRALAAEEENDEPAALREYQAGLAENPASAVLHAGLGHLYRERLQLQEASRELSEAMTSDPSNPVVAFELGDVYQRLGQPARAIPLLGRALEIDPGVLLARWSRAKAYVALGENQKALADLEAAAPVDDSGELQWQLARLYQKLGENDLARQAQARSEEQRRKKAAGNR